MIHMVTRNDYFIMYADAHAWDEMFIYYCYKPQWLEVWRKTRTAKMATETEQVILFITEGVFWKQ
jgi:hypothetical protein